MARNLSRRRVLTHEEFMRFGGVDPSRRTRRKGRLPSKADVAKARWATYAPPAQLQREVDAAIYACPDGAACCDPDCVAENKRRADAAGRGR